MALRELAWGFLVAGGTALWDSIYVGDRLPRARAPDAFTRGTGRGHLELSAEAWRATQQKPGKEGTRTRVFLVLIQENKPMCAQIPVPEKDANHYS